MAFILEEYQPMCKNIVKISAIIGKFRPPNGWNRYFIFRLLSHALVSPGKLAELLDNVKMKLIEHFKEYELTMTEIHQYYD